jgi:uncharacterized repeat protein (TIGR03803 family)
LKKFRFAAPALLLACGAHAQTFSLLHAFSGKDGANPVGAVALNPASTVVYGTAMAGGGRGDGTLWSLAVGAGKPKFSTLVTFGGGTRGRSPHGALLYTNFPVNGTLYGTTLGGGTSGYGTVFSYAVGGGLSVLHSFAGGAGGEVPYGGVTLGIFNGTESIYGTTFYGGDMSCASIGCGTVFGIAPGKKFSVLHRFQGSDGYGPASTLLNFGGQLYGTTVYYAADAGSPFVMNPTSLSLNVFAAPAVNYIGGLSVDGNGNLWGLAFGGGAHGYGEIYRIDASGAVTDVYDFTNGSDGACPLGTLAVGQNNVLYGITQGVCNWGGQGNGGSGWGTVFQFDTNTYMLTTLHTFEGSDGANPQDGVAIDDFGNLYGVAPYGGKNNDGVIYKITF